MSTHISPPFSPWLMWAVSLSFLLFQFLLQLSAGVMINPLIKGFHLSALGAGVLAASFYFVYVLLQTPAGILVDRLGPRRLLGGGGFICACGCLLFASSHVVSAAILGRLLMGIGASCAFVSTLNIVAQWFAHNRFSMMVGFAETSGMCGTLIGNTLIARLLSHVSWRHVMLGASMLALILGILCFSIIRDKPAPNELPDQLPQSMKAFLKDVKTIITHVGLWLNGLYSGLMFSIVTVFAALWVIPYLQLQQHVSLPFATFESALVFMGIAIGGPLMGIIYNRLQHRPLFLCITALIATTLSSLIIFDTPHSIWYSGLLFFLLGIVCSSYVFNYSLANELVPKHVRSTSIGFTNTLCVATAPVLQPFVGWLLELSKKTSSAWHVYSIHDFHLALSVLPICLLLAAMIALMIPQPHQQTVAHSSTP